jgi:hypothetical protein
LGRQIDQPEYAARWVRQKAAQKRAAKGATAKAMAQLPELKTQAGEGGTTHRQRGAWAEGATTGTVGQH